MRAPASALALLILLVGHGARADTSSAEMVDKGIQLRREHRDAEALEQFRRADKLNPAPRIRAQIGLAEQALGEWIEAEKDLNQALSANEDPWIVDRTQALGKALAAIQQHLGSLTIETSVNGAELWVNGARAGSLPMSAARVVAGTVNIEIRAHGYLTARRSIDVPPGSSAAERMELTPAPPPSAETADSNRSTVALPAADAPAPPSTQRFLAWSALSAAGAFLGSGIAGHIMHEQYASTWNDAPECNGPSSPTANKETRCGAYKGRAETAQVFAYVGYIGAGALGIASAVLFLTAPSSRPKKAAFYVDAGPGSVGVGCRGTL